MMELFKAYQCPYCLQWFNTIEGGQAHSEKCESVRWSQADGSGVKNDQ